MLDLKALLRSMVARGASDLHLKVGCPPIMRLNTELLNVSGPALAAGEVERLVRDMVSDAQWAAFQSKGELDFAYLLDGGAERFRTNIFRQRGLYGAVMRHVKTRVPDFHELGLPPILERIALARRGIVIVSGATGCGKSTTLAAIINYMNAKVRRHIVTVEDPIEYLHPDNKSVIDQREVGIDTRSFATALRHVMRQDPDVIMVGEMRDRESFMAVFSAADVGRLVFGTLHAPEASQVVLRMMDFFPADEREGARLQFAANMEAVICQRLLPRRDGRGLIPAVEILLGTPLARKFIRENKIEKLAAAIQDGRDQVMLTFNHSLVELVKGSLITEETALAHSTNPEGLKMNLRGIFLDESRKILGDD